MASSDRDPPDDRRRNADDADADAPVALAVDVTMTRRPSNHRWARHSWRLSQVRVGDIVITAPAPTPLSDLDDAEDSVWRGLKLTLYRDEAESYYHNLMAPTPSLYVVTRQNEHQQPQPIRVSASFDEANAYIEADDNAYSLPLPEPLCLWLERFVLTHYVPEPRKKRRRQDWKRSDPSDR